MPRKLQVRALNELSLAELAGIIVVSVGKELNYCNRFGIEADLSILIVEVNTYLEECGATNDIYEDLLRVILSSDTLEASIRFFCFQMLLNERVQCLVTEIFPFSYYDKVLQVIAAQGKGLRYLNLKGLWLKQGYMHLVYCIIKQLHNLKMLTIPYIANDKLLRFIGKYSTNLRQLDISGEVGITEVGLECLCYGVCRNLITVLDIGALGEENICHMDIAMLLLYLPNLKNLKSYSFVGKSLTYIYENHSTDFVTKLLYIHDTDTNAKTMEIIVKTCPLLEDIYLDSPENAILQQLEVFDLRRLKLFKFRCEDLLPVLHKIGYKLQHLTVIKGKGDLEISQLMYSCSALIDLDFYMMDLLTYNSYKSFESLEGLEILSSPISLTGLKNFICKSSKLKRLAVDVVNFEDEDLRGIFLENDFKELEDVWFTSAPNLTLDTIELMIQKCPELQSLGQLSGWKLTRDDVTLLQGILKSSNSALALSPASIFP